MAEVAIAILNYNGAEHLKTFLPSIIKHSPEARIVIGDNASTDNSIELLENDFVEVELIKLSENHGYAGGYNLLIDKIDEEFIILANSDIEASENWISPLLNVLKKDDQVAAVQPKILSWHHREQFEYAGAGGGFMDRYGYPYCRGRIFSHIEVDDQQYNDEIDVFWASGACFIIRKSVFNTVGGFDESFFAHMEEIDLNWRLQNLGYKIKYTGASKVFHLGGGTLSYDNPRKTYLNFRNGWLMMIKNLHEYSRPATFFTRYFLDLVSVLFYLVQFKILSAFAVLRAHLYLLVHVRSITKPDLKKVKTARNSSKIQPGNFSLVWLYFIKRKRKYSDL